ncbi:MAG: hypothetical protein ACI4KR_09310, partial [Ruminiclostridium sp.]
MELIDIGACLIENAIGFMFSWLLLSRETLNKSNSPRSNAHTHAAEFDTLRFNQRVPRETLIKSNSPRSNAHTHAAEFDT